ncbi:MAG: DHHA1 domain-containing protein [archaeon]
MIKQINNTLNLKEKIFCEFEIFLKQITKTSKSILLLTHSDTDGLTSAYCLKKVLLSKNIKVQVLPTSFSGYTKDIVNYVNKNIKLKTIDTIIQLDFSRTDLFSRFENKNYFLIDHHLNGIVSKDLENKIFNISKYFGTGKTPSLGAFLFSYSKSIGKISYPFWFTMIARLADGLYDLNSFFIELNNYEKEKCYFFGMPKKVFITDFFDFFECFFRNNNCLQLVYLAYEQTIDSNDIYYYQYNKTKFTKLWKMYEQNNLEYKKALAKYFSKNKVKVFEKEKFVYFETNSQTGKFSRDFHSINELRFPNLISIIVVKEKDGYKLSIRSNNLKFDIMEKLKPIFDSYFVEFGGHAYAGGGFFKSKYKIRFFNDLKTTLRDYYQK